MIKMAAKAVQLTLITGNANKLKEVKAILEPAFEVSEFQFQFFIFNFNLIT